MKKDSMQTSSDAQSTSSTKSKKTRSSSQKKSKTSSMQSSRFKQKDKILLKLFMDNLKDMYWAEKALVKALPQMASAATSEEVQYAFEDHLEVTQGQVERLEHVFQILGEKARAKKCEAMDGLIKEGHSLIEETKEGTATRDCALIMAAQKVEHYEIATYGSLVQIARTLEEDEVASILKETLDEEKETDLHLTEIAENSVNEQANHEDWDGNDIGDYSSRSRSDNYQYQSRPDFYSNERQFMFNRSNNRNNWPRQNYQGNNSSGQYMSSRNREDSIQSYGRGTARSNDRSNRPRRMA